MEVTFALNGLARLYLRTDRPAEAEELLRESLSIFDETLPKHWRRGYAEALLGAALTQQDRFEEAEEPLLRSFDVVRTARGDGDVFTSEVLDALVDLYEAWDKPAEAERYRALSGK